MRHLPASFRPKQNYTAPTDVGFLSREDVISVFSVIWHKSKKAWKKRSSSLRRIAYALVLLLPLHNGFDQTDYVRRKLAGSVRIDILSSLVLPHRLKLSNLVVVKIHAPIFLDLSILWANMRPQLWAQ